MSATCPIPGGAAEGKGYVRKLEKWVKGQGYGGLPHLILKGSEADGSLKKALSAEESQRIFTHLECADTDLVVFG